MYAPCTRLDKFFISLKEMHACVCNIDDIEAIMQSTCVCTRNVHDNLHKHACMSVMYTPNLVCMHIDMYMNCKPRMTV